MDNRLTWKTHAANGTRMAEKSHKYVRTTVYGSLFESIMRYGISVWGTAVKTHMHSLLPAKEMLSIYSRRRNVEWLGDVGPSHFMEHLTPEGLYIYIVCTKVLQR